MQSHYQCTECGTAVRIPLCNKPRYSTAGFKGCITHRNVTLRAPIPTVTCPRCGDVSDIDEQGHVQRRYSALHMMPVDHDDGTLSKWMLPHTRPIRPGLYQCKFRHTGDSFGPSLRWTGYYFACPLGRRVDCTQLLTWRGVLA